MRRIAGRHREQIDRIRERFERGGGARSHRLGESITRLSMVVDRTLQEVDAEREDIDRLRGAFDRIPQGVVLADTDGGVVYRNHIAEDFVDTRHGDALISAAIAELAEAAAEGDRQNRTIDLVGPPRRAIQLRSGPLRADEDREILVGTYVLIEDITERQRLESMRRDFLANISHELKTPVGALGVLAEAMVEEPDPDVVRRMAARMFDESHRMADLIEDLLELSRIEVDRLPDPEPVDLGEVVDQAIERTAAEAGERGVRLETGPVDDLTVLGHRRQLVSALTNLVDNAVKYSDPGGLVLMTGGRDRDRVILSIADRGVGIPQRDLERIFERFYRVDPARSRETGGTGLGLSIVRHVIQNHEGEIEVTSREGHGTTFTVLLPATGRTRKTGEPR